MTSQVETGDSSVRELEQILSDCFGLQGSLIELPGEHDLNYRVETELQGACLLKLHVPGDEAVLDMQMAVLEHLAGVAPDLPISRSIADKAGDLATDVVFRGPRTVRLLTWLEGKVWAKADNRSRETAKSLGALLGRLDKALATFEHPGASRVYEWDIACAQMHQEHVDLIGDAEKRHAVGAILDRFSQVVAPVLETLPRQVIHNDANDYNVLLDDAGKVCGLLDFGDMVESQRIVEIAVASAYALIGEEDPVGTIAALLEGYHKINPVTEQEAELVLDLVKTRYAVSICMAAKQIRENPDNTYLLVSQEDVWRELRRLNNENPQLAKLRLRTACGFDAVPTARKVKNWLDMNAHTFSPVVKPDVSSPRTVTYDFSSRSPDAAELATFDGLEFDAYCERAIQEAGADFGLGVYGEDRTVYKSDAFEMGSASIRRSVHLGIDIFNPDFEPVHAPISGRVAFFHDDNVDNGFGPTVLLEHETDDGVVFWTLYGHLSRRSCAKLEIGQTVEAGEAFAEFGQRSENGAWPPHLHFQIVTDHLGLEARMHGVGVRAQWPVWRDISPDPSVVLGLPVPAAVPVAMDNEQLVEERHHRIGRSLSIAYSDAPLKIVGGEGTWLIDETGKRWLDMVNNVCHVGHCHPRVVASAQKQMAQLNTNSRYLHDTLVEYSRRLTDLFPDPLNVCFFVNSGSEANDLALRLARAHTGQRDILTVDHAYHGHLSSLIDVSPYKFAGKGGEGAPDHVHVVEMPDLYRGRWRYGDDDAGQRYARKVSQKIAELGEQGRKPALFFSEGILGTGGQLTLPAAYLQEAYAHVRAAGGLCLADEVQVGFGRVGSHMWAFETQNVVPDIVSLGKPIGNGHPMAAVVTTEAVAASFANGMEYFNTFGGNPVSASIGLAVLDVIRDERLMHHCHEVGTRLMSGARALANRFPIIGDVRGQGLFIGIELVRDRATLEPADTELEFVIRGMKQRHGILLSSEGPHNNVLKIKPPAQFGDAECDLFLEALADMLQDHSDCSSH
ncbi:MAG: aminotransferase class III-fold pyridoxal phosphate-dependent enzyme [Roseibium sp.]|uniref:aminotransferase class III-fold pyridoxal phosphate-dependent enzyme n=1 Tax=Roseibium sp. TaxID=1936156 RepID=UPI001B04AB45|nr:aminotransferase class III-fold pyridoxal phosphate-dependent enzyme [Roseibium sp.]MBO6893090.1 aminotransferase class III-fold pyridoxal phosphate-dependent enzyme [Roseibium sp.]MBO6932552.1 aminotransferase class III-fold pyridoxal phosphate-dependent enzyme [Roseibium sp.]